MINDPDDLTPREEEILMMLTEGIGTRQIAEMLVVSPATVRNHIQSIMNKLGVHSRLAAVAATRRERGPAERVLRFCERDGLGLTEHQQEKIREAFRLPQSPLIPEQSASPETLPVSITISQS